MAITIIDLAYCSCNQYDTSTCFIKVRNVLNIYNMHSAKDNGYQTIPSIWYGKENNTETF